MLMNPLPGHASEGSLLADDQFLRRVSRLYYEDGTKQEDIAVMLNCSRQTIGKALQRARERAIVRISVVPEERSGYLHNLARDLRLKLHLEDLVLVPGGNFDKTSPERILDGVLADITICAANYLDQLIKDNDILAVSGGKEIMRNVVRYLKPAKVLPNLRVVSTIGFVSKKTNYGDANMIAFDIATAYGAEHEWLPIPAIVETQEQLQQAQSLPIVREVFKTMQEANVIMMGLWPAQDNHKPLGDRILTQEQLDILQSYNPVMDINHWIFDANGACVNRFITPPPYYLTGLEIPQLKDRVKQGVKAILVAGASASYVPGILAALNAGIANILITDHVTAELLMASQINL